MDKHYTYNDLLNIIEVLRGDDGCPWDKVQTHQSLSSNVIEESYELAEAINNYDTDNIKEELGDLLLQVVMHAQIAKESKNFTIEDVIDCLCTKLVYRHPHVFNNRKRVDTPDTVTESWEQLKKKEKRENTTLDGIERVAKALPALIRAYKVQKKSKEISYFCEDQRQLEDKVNRAYERLILDAENKESKQLEEELGDLLLEMVNLSYILKINPEFALTKSLEKFINRFRYIENWAFARGKQASDLTFEEIGNIWKESKKM